LDPHTTDAHNLTLFSFGHRYDTPKLITNSSNNPTSLTDQNWIANLIIDARVVPNPSREIRVNPGLSKTFQQTLFADPANEIFYQQFLNTVSTFCICAAEKLDCPKGLRVAIGCQMGRHRSVAIVSRMAEELPDLLGRDWKIETRHRDIDKKNKEKAKAKQRVQ